MGAWNEGGVGVMLSLHDAESSRQNLLSNHNELVQWTRYGNNLDTMLGDFPSGNWRGYYHQVANAHCMMPMFGRISCNQKSVYLNKRKTYPCKIKMQLLTTVNTHADIHIHTYTNTYTHTHIPHPPHSVRPKPLSVHFPPDLLVRWQRDRTGSVIAFYYGDIILLFRVLL